MHIYSAYRDDIVNKRILSQLLLLTLALGQIKSSDILLYHHINIKPSQ